MKTANDFIKAKDWKGLAALTRYEINVIKIAEGKKKENEYKSYVVDKSTKARKPIQGGINYMNKEELSTLIKIKAEIEQIKQELSKTEPEYGTDAVTGSSPNFPYVKHSIIIEGYDIKTYNSKVKRIQSRLSRKLIELVNEQDKLTEYIYEL